MRIFIFGQNTMRAAFDMDVFITEYTELTEEDILATDLHRLTRLRFFYHRAHGDHGDNFR